LPDGRSAEGLAFGPDGNLYVAEGGRGGSNSTVGQCEQVPAPVGPYTGGHTARISKISPSGRRTTLVDGLPSDQTSPAVGGTVSGVADVAFIGHRLYALLAGAGCSHGNPGTVNAVLRVHRDGSWRVVANLSRFLMTHPVANPEADDFEPDGTWYDMVAVHGLLYAVEPNHGELDRINPRTHRVSRVGTCRPARATPCRPRSTSTTATSSSATWAPSRSCPAPRRSGSSPARASCARWSAGSPPSSAWPSTSGRTVPCMSPTSAT
jgi:hypothetical protein